MISLIYLIGCILAFFVVKKHLETVKEIYKTDYESQACIMYTFGIIASWITVISYIYNKYFSE